MCCRGTSAKMSGKTRLVFLAFMALLAGAVGKSTRESKKGATSPPGNASASPSPAPSPKAGTPEEEVVEENHTGADAAYYSDETVEADSRIPGDESEYDYYQDDDGSLGGSSGDPSDGRPRREKGPRNRRTKDESNNDENDAEDDDGGETELESEDWSGPFSAEFWTRTYDALSPDWA